MGIIAIAFGISLIVLIASIIAYRWFDSNRQDFGAIFSGTMIVISAISMFWFGITFGVYGYCYSIRNYDISNANYGRANMIRMLNEDYNPDNLTAALKFNLEQKTSANYNKSFMMLCWQKCYSVDTIPIPSEKYVPSNMIKLDAVVDHLVDKMAQEKTGN